MNPSPADQIPRKAVWALKWNRACDAPDFRCRISLDGRRPRPRNPGRARRRNPACRACSFHPSSPISCVEGCDGKLLHELGEVVLPSAVGSVTADWRAGLPVLSGPSRHAAGTARVGCAVALRDADGRRCRAIYFAAGRRRWMASNASSPGRKCSASPGTYACFAVTLDASDTAVASFNCGRSKPASAPRNGDLPSARHTGDLVRFKKARSSCVQFAFDAVGVHRLEARAAVRNERGNAALRKLGAVREGRLRRSLLTNGEYIRPEPVDDPGRGLAHEASLGHRNRSLNILPVSEALAASPRPFPTRTRPTLPANHCSPPQLRSVIRTDTNVFGCAN